MPIAAGGTQDNTNVDQTCPDEGSVPFHYFSYIRLSLFSIIKVQRHRFIFKYMHRKIDIIRF